MNNQLTRLAKRFIESGMDNERIKGLFEILFEITGTSWPQVGSSQAEPSQESGYTGGVVTLPEVDYLPFAIEWIKKEEAEAILAKWKPELEKLEAEREKLKGVRGDDKASIRRNELDENLIPQAKWHIREANKKLRKKYDDIEDEAERKKLFEKAEKRFKDTGGKLTEDERSYHLNKLIEEALASEESYEFFPTPDSVVDYMISRADFEPGMTMLEPSAGKGNITDKVRNSNPSVKIDCVEIFPLHRQILQMKGYNLVGDDFLQFDGKRYDRILMNPPFGKGADIVHVNHAYKYLKPGGKIIAVTSRRAYTGSDYSNTAFRLWVDEHKPIGASEHVKLFDHQTMRDAEKAATVQILVIEIEKPFDEDQRTGIITKIEPVEGMIIKDTIMPDRNIYEIIYVDPKLQNPYKLRNLVTEEITELPVRSMIDVSYDSDGNKIKSTEKVKMLEIRYQLPTESEVSNAILEREAFLARGTTEQGEISKNQRSSYSCGAGGSTGGACHYPPRRNSQDTSVKPVRFITGRPEWTKPARGFYVDERFTKLVDSTGKPIIFDHVFEGANKAIESIDIDNRRSFLLADGTGTGKTIQQLMVAYYFLKKYDKAVMIITENDKIVEQSFFGDAKKLGIADLCAFLPKRVQGDFDFDGKKIWFAKYKDAIRYSFKSKTKDGRVEEQKALDSYMPVYKNAKQEHLDRLSEIREEAKKRKWSDEYKDELIKSAEREWFSSSIYLTYRGLADAWLGAEKYQFQRFTEKLALVIFDECHNLRNYQDYNLDDGMMSRRCLHICDGIALSGGGLMFASATPIDKVDNMYYLKYTGMFRDEAHFVRSMTAAGWRLEYEERNENGQIIMPARWKYSQGFPPEIAYKALEYMFEDLTEDGGMLKREIALDNMTVQILNIPELPAEAKEAASIVESALRAKIKPGSKSTAQKIGNLQMELMRLLEPYKIAKTLELTKFEIQKGRNVVVFSGLQEEKDVVKEGGQVSAGTANLLYKRFQSDYGRDCVAMIIGGLTQEKILADVKDFQAGCKRIAIATTGAGGTGISLDDQDIRDESGKIVQAGGSNPRTLLCMTAPFSATSAVQMLGRINRAGTKSRSKAYFLFANGLPIEEWLKTIIMKKMAVLNAAVMGETGELFKPDDIVEVEGGEERDYVKIVANKPEKKDDDKSEKKEKERKHSFFDRLDEIDGRILPTQKPFIIQHKQSRYVSENLVIIRSPLSGDLLKNWANEFKQELERFGFIKFSDRYSGSWYQAKYTNEAWEFLLNFLKPEKLEYIYTEMQLFYVGSKISAIEDIVESNIMRGMTGVVLQVRERYKTDSEKNYLYKVEWENGLVTNRVPQWQLEDYEDNTAEHLKPLIETVEENWQRIESGYKIKYEKTIIWEALPRLENNKIWIPVVLDSDLDNIEKGYFGAIRLDNDTIQITYDYTPARRKTHGKNYNIIWNRCKNLRNFIEQLRFQIRPVQPTEYRAVAGLGDLGHWGEPTLPQFRPRYEPKGIVYLTNENEVVLNAKELAQGLGNKFGIDYDGFIIDPLQPRIILKNPTEFGNPKIDYYTTLDAERYLRAINYVEWAVVDLDNIEIKFKYEIADIIN